jgi:hypothetical protein
MAESDQLTQKMIATVVRKAKLDGISIGWKFSTEIGAI